MAIEGINAALPPRRYRHGAHEQRACGAGMNEWLFSWKAGAHWRTSNKKLVLKRDLWGALDAAAASNGSRGGSARRK